ncbi:histone deacetylase [Aurantivibrio plasticivorans]
MKLIYNERYNFDLGLLKYLHPFEGTKFRAIYDSLKSNPSVDIVSPSGPISVKVVDEFLSGVMQHRVRNKNGVLNALEVPRIPLISYAYLEKRVLEPMRWAVAGTLLGAEEVLKAGGVAWNLGGGYHHAMQKNMEGFCIYNDIGICVQQLTKSGLLSSEDKILIIDTDAHHGNGNAYAFMENSNVTLLDVYNSAAYPTSSFTRERVNISVPLKPGTEGKEYLEELTSALSKIESGFKLAFVVAGTDVLASDKLGGFKLTIDDVAKREKITLDTLKASSIPAVVLGGGGYSKDSAKAVFAAVEGCVELTKS